MMTCANLRKEFGTSDGRFYDVMPCFCEPVWDDIRHFQLEDLGYAEIEVFEHSEFGHWHGNPTFLVILTGIFSYPLLL